MTADSAGTWLARSRDATTGKQIQSPLGEFSDHPAHARFDIASKAARDWFAHLGRGGKAKAITVKVACANYVKHLASAGKAQAALDTEKRFARWVDDHKIDGITLQKLKPGDIDGWRRGLAATPTIPHDKKSKKPTRARSASTLTCCASTRRRRWRPSRCRRRAPPAGRLKLIQWITLHPDAADRRRTA